MSSTTSRVSLYKPAGGENVNVTTDLNNNWDKIDTNLNFRVVASATARNAISPYWAGLGVQQTDNEKLYVTNGSAPISGSWREIVQTNNEVAGELWVGNLIRSTRTLSTDSAYEGRVSGNAFARWFVKANGETWWGSGAATQDTNLYRSAADTLRTDDNMIVAGDLTVSGGGITIGSAATIGTALSASTTVTSTATETVVATYTIPANDMIAGAVYKLTAWGTVNTVATPPTLNIKGRIGGVGGATFAQTGTIAQIASVTTRVIKVEVYLVCLTTGASGTVFGNLDVWNGAATGVPGTTNPTVFSNTASANSGHIMDGGAPSTVNTTTSLDLVITALWASSNTAALVIRGFAAERLA